MHVSQSTLTLLSPFHVPSEEAKKNSLTDEEVLFIATLAVITESLSSMGALFFTASSSCMVECVLLSGTASLAGCVFIVNVERIAAKKNALCQAETPSPIVYTPQKKTST